MRQYTIFTLLFLIHFGILNAQNTKTTKEESAAIDSVYQLFSDSYTSFDADWAARCYAENAVSIAHYEGKVPYILNGHKEILDDFKSFFNTIKSNNQTMTIAFKIIERTKKNDKIFDIGYYKLSFLKDGKEVDKAFGKVAIILAKNAKNKWQYETDTNSTATESEFNKSN